MDDEQLRPVLAGKKALIFGIANEDSIAYGCAKAFRLLGADLAVSWLNEKARPFVEPLAQELKLGIHRRSRRRGPTTVGGDVRPSTLPMGPARHSRPFDRLRAQGKS